MDGLHCISGTCDLCGEACDANTQELNVLSCTFKNCEDLPYHQDCLEKVGRRLTSNSIRFQYCAWVPSVADIGAPAQHALQLFADASEAFQLWHGCFTGCHHTSLRIVSSHTLCMLCPPYSISRVYAWSAIARLASSALGDAARAPNTLAHVLAR